MDLAGRHLQALGDLVAVSRLNCFSAPGEPRGRGRSVGPSSAVATEILLADRGRFLVGGEITSPRLDTGSCFALGRYLSGGWPAT